jgi:hypothetical protein
VSGIKLWMLCLYFPGAVVVTLICYRAGMGLILPVTIFSVYDIALTAFYLLERWTDDKRKTKDESKASA